MQIKTYRNVLSLSDLFSSHFRGWTFSHLEAGEPRPHVFSLLRGRYPDTPAQLLDGALSLVEQSRTAASELPTMGPADDRPPSGIPVNPIADKCEYQVETFWTDPDTEETMSSIIYIKSSGLLRWNQIYDEARQRLQRGKIIYRNGEPVTIEQDIADITVRPLMVWGC